MDGMGASSEINHLHSDLLLDPIQEVYGFEQMCHSVLFPAGASHGRHSRLLLPLPCHGSRTETQKELMVPEFCHQPVSFVLDSLSLIRLMNQACN